MDDKGGILQPDSTRPPFRSEVLSVDQALLLLRPRDSGRQASWEAVEHIASTAQLLIDSDAGWTSFLTVPPVRASAKRDKGWHWRQRCGKSEKETTGDKPSKS